MVNAQRIRKLNKKEYISGPILYWMSRDHRVCDNWALIHAQELAKKCHTSFAVAFCLRERFDFATERLVDFMLEGLKEVERGLVEKHIPFYFLLGDPVEEITKFMFRYKIGYLVSDFSPLKYNRKWKNEIVKKLNIPFDEVDAHNIIPVWRASQKQEYGAYTLRPKINTLLPSFLEQFIPLEKQSIMWPNQVFNTDWNRIDSRICVDRSVPKILSLIPGEKAAMRHLQIFCNDKLSRYADERNNPVLDSQSGLSPYLHFGHIASQRITLQIKTSSSSQSAKDVYLEELIVRKELAENYCFYNSYYDNPSGFPEWARMTIEKHVGDKRPYLYSLEQLKNASTHDSLWNAAQKQMNKTGKMHGYMRMYWAKKIFEWSSSVDIAQKHALYLNDTYFLDGRDPNGYAGIAWSMGGVHDRPWFERPIFGKIRYMSASGASAKFDTSKYIAKYLP